MIITRTRLCTRLVILLGYTSRHQLLFTVVLLIFYLHAYSCYCYSVACLSSDLIILCLQLFLLLVYAHCLYARAFPFTHTLTRSRSDEPGFARPDIGRLFLLCRCSMRLYALRGTGRSLSLLILVFFPFFIPAIIFDSCISHLAFILFLISFEIMCSLICIIAVITDYYSPDL